MTYSFANKLHFTRVLLSLLIAIFLAVSVSVSLSHSVCVYQRLSMCAAPASLSPHNRAVNILCFYTRLTGALVTREDATKYMLLLMLLLLLLYCCCFYCLPACLA